MKNWLRALLSETASTAWWILSSLSTLSTFFLKGWSGKPRLASAISAVLGFAWANFKVFQKQESRNSALSAELARFQDRISQLKISPADGSRYYLVPVSNAPDADFSGGYFEFHLMIENTGRKNSTITKYEVEIIGLRQKYSDLQPSEGVKRVQSRHCQHGLNASLTLTKTGLIKIDAESATDYGTLLFLIRGLNRDQFVKAGIVKQGEQGKLVPLRCRLTVTDTENSKDTREFELFEA